MLSKKFKGNKIYEVTRYIFKYGNEEDEMENTVTVWDSLEKAKAYIERYATGLKWAGAQIEVINLDREITVEDYKSGNYNVVSFQKIYDVTLDWIEDETPEEVIVLDKEEYTETYQVSRFGCCPMDKSFKTLILATSNLFNYVVPKTVTRILHVAFFSENFQIIIFPPSVIYFETFILVACKALTKVIIQGNAIFEGTLYGEDCSNSFAIDYYGTKPVYKEITSSKINNIITVCDGYGATTFSKITPYVNNDCPSFPYKNSCKNEMILLNNDILKLLQINFLL